MRLELSNATVAYPINISSRQQSIFAQAVKHVSFGKLGKSNSDETFIIALNNISMNIAEGSRIGLIGGNGSGKSTLLKTLAGIIYPQFGKRNVNGSIGCLLNLGAGLEHDRSGIENLRMIARLYGLEGADYRNAVDDAAEFTELGNYLNLPVRTYSTGMTARLCFAIATAKHSDIMLIDEVIGTGDVHFVNKAVTRVKEICAKSGAVVIASHSWDVLRDFCDEGMWLNSGKIKSHGKIADVWNEYITQN